MATWWTNIGKKEQALLELASTDLRFMLASSAPPSKEAAADLQFLSEVIGLEVNGAGYDRRQLSGVGVNQDNANNRGTLVASPLGVYPGANFGSVAGGWLFRHTGANTTAALWLWIGLPTIAVTDGRDFLFNWNANGLSYIE